MFSTFATVILILSLVFGGGAVTVTTAQTSQPDQLLYPIKLASEDVRLGLTSNLEAQSQLAMQFASRRVEEIQTQLEAGGMPNEAVQLRYQSQVEQAVQSALGLPADKIPAALEQIRTQLQSQQQTLAQAQGNGSPALLKSQEMIQDRLQTLSAVLADPSQLVTRLQDQLKDQQRDQLKDQSQDQQKDQLRDQDRLRIASPAAPDTLVQGAGSSGNPWNEGTPTPDSSYGPGPGTGACADCTPQVNSGVNNPWTEETPIPGSGYGPGPGPDAESTCTPGAGPQEPQQYGQNEQPSQPQNPNAGPQQPAGTGGQGGKH